MIGGLNGGSKNVLAETIGQPGKAPGRHADAEVRPLHIACRDFRRRALDCLAAYRYYLGRRIAVRSGRAKIDYSYGLDDDTMGAAAEGVADPTGG
jgi:hypothetical protein